MINKLPEAAIYSITPPPQVGVHMFRLLLVFFSGVFLAISSSSSARSQWRPHNCAISAAEDAANEEERNFKCLFDFRLRHRRRARNGSLGLSNRKQVSKKIRAKCVQLDKMMMRGLVFASGNVMTVLF